MSLYNIFHLLEIVGFTIWSFGRKGTLICVGGKEKRAFSTPLLLYFNILVCAVVVIFSNPYLERDEKY